VASLFLSGRLLTAAVVQTQPDPDRVSPGFAGFLVVFLLAIATILLIRSMTRHLRKVRYSPDPSGDQNAPGQPRGPRE
jgi:hypothetical protein